MHGANLKILKMRENLSILDEKDADELADTLVMAKEELTKLQPKESRLKNYLTLLVPISAVSKGIPALAMNLQNLYDLIMQYLK